MYILRTTDIVFLANFVAKTVSELVAKTIEQAQVINNDPKLIETLFHHGEGCQ